MTEEKKTQLLESAYPMDYLQKIAMGDSPAPPQLYSSLLGPPAPTPLQQESQIGAEEYLRALAISQQRKQIEFEQQQSLLSLMNQPSMLE